MTLVISESEVCLQATAQNTYHIQLGATKHIMERTSKL